MGAAYIVQPDLPIHSVRGCSRGADGTLSALKITSSSAHFGSDAVINGKFFCIKDGGNSISHSALPNKVIYCYLIHISLRFWQDYRIYSPI